MFLDLPVFNRPQVKMKRKCCVSASNLLSHELQCGAGLPSCAVAQWAEALGVSFMFWV